MGLYRAVARPLLFALPPEAAHRVAGALLGLPLPWSRIGGAPDDPALRVSLHGIALANPIGLAAGFDKSCTHLDALGRLGFGYVVGGTVTRAPRRGNAKPRMVRDSDRGALLNSMGLPNPGADAAAEALRRSERTAPRIVSLADEGVEDVLAAFGVLEPLVDGFELNSSSPNAGWEHELAHVDLLVRELRARTGKPILVKLPRFETDEERDGVLGMAVVARDAGASGLTCSNTRPVEDARLSTGRGGLSGRPLSELTPGIVREVLEATGGTVPVHACGGISTAEDALACLRAGATTVQVYTGLVFEGPRIVGNIARGLAAFRLGYSPEQAR
ncbi:MAG TPA: dihydroorotate dehydrogenase 2 [Actinomycetota bacterium]|nr:dihydroorotate dehydrogenase 2 [Actinomycetota bacterium]